MAAVRGLTCTRCGAVHPPDRFVDDCPICREVAPANLAVAYETASRRIARIADGPRSIWRYAALLPVPAAAAVSLGEGMTPLVPLIRAGEALGLRRLYGKDESGNPTGSFKDRLASVAVSAARSMGAPAIASSSTGNAGAAAAAYAARAGLPCVVFTGADAPPAMAAQIRACGAAVVGVEEMADRWSLLAEGIARFGWFPTSPHRAPAVGSNPYGIEGYKTIAYEVAEDLGWRAPDWCVLPVCYGDALVGMWRGFTEMLEMGWIADRPRMVAAEVYGSLGAALAAGSDTVPEMAVEPATAARSIGAARGTYQSLRVIRDSGGEAVTVSDRAMRSWQRALATRDGLFVELASAAALAAVDALRAGGAIAPDETTVVLLTATGLKDLAPAVEGPGAIPVVPPDLDAALAVLKRVYRFDPRVSGGG